MSATNKLEELEAALARLKAAANDASTQIAQPQASEHKKRTLSDILAEQQRKTAQAATVTKIDVPSQEAMIKEMTAAVGNVVHWNEKQAEAIRMTGQGKSFCLIGAAGTGKTTTLKGCIAHLEVNHLLPPLKSGSKYLVSGMLGIVFVSYTRRAVRQIARQLPAHLQRQALTIHKLLEYEPVFYEYTKPDGSLGKTVRFEPARSQFNPLPPEIKVCVVDESSMVEKDPLFNNLKAALPPSVQFIFLGDLHQLPPVYGESVLAEMLTVLPVVELTEVYRQALESPIIKLATDIKNGIPIPVTGKIKNVSPKGDSDVVINPWPKQLSGEDALDAMAATIKKVIDLPPNNGGFNDEEDVVLMPFNKSCGTLELNLHIANHLGIKRGAVVHHVIAGFNHFYLAAGDRVLVDKQDCVITDIIKNPKYVGKPPMEPATTLDRWGTYQDETAHHYLETSNEDIDELMERMAANGIDDKVNEASHVLVLESLDSGLEFRVSQVGTLNNMVFSYALTVHKSQGSEWRRVFLFLHASHHVMCSRELLYTAVTRAREDLIILCEPDRSAGKNPGTLTKAAKSPRIKGNTLAEKLEFLKQRAAERTTKKGKDELAEDDQ